MGCVLLKMKDPAESRRLIKFFWWIKCSIFWHGNLRVVTKLTSFVDRLLLLMSGIGHPHETPGMCALRIKMLRKGWQGGGGRRSLSPSQPPPPLFITGTGTWQDAQQLAKAVQGVQSGDTETHGQQRPQ